MLYIPVNAYYLKELFIKAERDYFSLEACEVIIEYFDDISEELDIIGLCCDFTEAPPEDILNDYDYLLPEAPTDEDILEELNMHTWAVMLQNGNILYLNF